MSVDLALIKLLENNSDDLQHFLSAFPTQFLFRMQQAKDGSGRPEYVGYAPADALLGESKWLIFKYVYDGAGFNTQKLLANGEAKFNKIWSSGSNEYASYTYTTT